MAAVKTRNRLVTAREFGLGMIFVVGLASAIARAGDHESAKAQFSDANHLFDQGHFAEAVAAYDRVLGDDPKYIEGFYNRALANEMVDRGKALADWQRFLDAAGDRPEFKWDVARVKARIQILKDKPPLPDTIQPGRYVASAGDYYREISRASEGEQWSELPVKVFLGNAPSIKWQQGAREAYDIWSAVFPMQLVAMAERADISLDWAASLDQPGLAADEEDRVRDKRLGGQITGRRIAVVTVDLSRLWSKDEMRAIILHELGHALGIKGHSATKKDIMYWQEQEKSRRLVLPSGASVPFPWKSLVKEPSQRDLNTLIRLYNSPGTIARFD
jgi:predicted Zn-dependent protease